MTKRSFTMPDGKIMTASVMSEEEFAELLVYLKGNNLVPTIEEFKKRKIVPLIFRGSKTEPIFVKYQIDTQYCSFVVRGFAKEFFKNQTLISREEAEEMFVGTYEKLNEEAKKLIDSTIEEILTALSQSKTPEHIFMQFINKIGKNAPRQIRLNLADSMINSANVTLSSFRNSFNGKEEVLTEYKKYLIRLFTGCYLAIMEAEKSEQN